MNAAVTQTVTQFAAELADREAIRDLLLRYARATDRCDAALLTAVFWPDATTDYEGFHVGAIAPYIVKSTESMREQMEQTAHLIGNMLIEIDGDTARGETYVFAFHRLPGADGPKDLLLGGRYLDRFAKRDDCWRITHRRLVADWFREFPDSGDWNQGFFGLRMKSGSRSPNDPSYESTFTYQPAK
ncbi:MAG: nuclear transport factor 2 family protein [Steroidobacteraceae bacterium]